MYYLQVISSEAEEAVASLRCAADIYVERKREREIFKTTIILIHRERERERERETTRVES